MQAVQWAWVVLDEAQNIKNPEAKQTQAIRKFPAEFRLALTGTPVENRLSELWSIMHFLNPGYLGARARFRSEFSIPIERYHDEEAVAAATETRQPIYFAARQDRPTRDPGFARKSGNEGLLHPERGAGHAVRGGGTGHHAADRRKRRHRAARAGAFDADAAQANLQPPGAVSAPDPAKAAASDQALEGRSGKLERLAELLEEILAEGDRALIFTQFAEMGELLAGYLPRAVGAGDAVFARRHAGQERATRW